MKVSTPIHLVKPKNYDALNDIYAVFDSKEKATQFVDKFKNRPDMEIIDGILNPDYSIDKTSAPYYISLAQTGSTPKDIFVCDHTVDAQDRHEEYNICFYGVSKPSQGLFILKIFAIDQKEGLKRAIRIRNAAIKYGEWDLAWQKYNQQQPRFNRFKVF